MLLYLPSLLHSMMPRISVEKRSLVLEFTNGGMTQKKIAQTLHISRRSVQYLMRKFKETGRVADRERSGRPRILTKRMERRVLRMSKGNPTWTARKVRQESNLTDVVSINTVKRTLRRHGLFGRVAVRKPYLSSRHRKNRFLWCSQRLNWPVDKWEKVIFSDECKLELHPNRRLLVRRRVGERLKAKYLRTSVKFPSSIMVWGAIRGDGNRVLVRCERNVDSQEYQRVLSVGLPHIYESGHAFQQDGAPAHRSSSTTKFLDEQGLQVLRSWPSQSPDLSVIENIWEHLKSKILLHNPRSHEDIWKVAVEEWNAIPRERIRSLYASIPRRLAACVRAKGGHTKY